MPGPLGGNEAFAVQGLATGVQHGGVEGHVVVRRGCGGGSGRDEGDQGGGVGGVEDWKERCGLVCGLVEGD